MHIRSDHYPYAHASDYPTCERRPIIRSESPEAADRKPFEPDPEPFQERRSAREESRIEKEAIYVSISVQQIVGEVRVLLTPLSSAGGDGNVARREPAV